MTFRTRVALVKRIAAGEGVSYGHEWVAPSDRVLALVPTGYADGVPRRLGGTMTVQLAGRRRPVVGRVCMDQVVVDLGRPPTPRTRSSPPATRSSCSAPATRASRRPPSGPRWLDTIHYEVVTGVGCRPRVTRTSGPRA